MANILYLQTKECPNGDLAFPPVSKIRLKSYPSDKNGKIYLCTVCQCYADVEYVVELIKRDLEEILKTARKKYGVSKRASRPK